MSMSGNILKKRGKTLIIADDGIGIWGITAERSEIGTDHCFPAGTDLKTILEYGKEQNIRNVLCLQTADVRELDVKLGRDLSEEERQSAIEYAATSDLGDHSGGQRISYMDGMFHDFRSGILASYFATESVLRMGETVKSMKMKFLGITNFKQLLLALHFSDREHHEDAFLFLLGNHGVAAIPDHGKLLIRNLPFGIPAPGSEKEWQERVQRRLNTIFRNKRVCLYTPDLNETLCSALKEISEAEMIEQMNWRESVAGGALFFLQNGCKLIHPALPPPKEKDPNRSGTYIGLFFLGATILSLGFLTGRNFYTKYVLLQEIETNQQKIDTIKKEKDVLQKLEKDLASQQELFFVMKQKQRISKEYLLVINLLSRYPLRYSRVTSIEEKSTGIHIEGESVWQPDLSNFFTHFEGELRKHHLTLFSDGLSKDKDGKIIFRSHIAAAGRNHKE